LPARTNQHLLACCGAQLAAARRPKSREMIEEFVKQSDIAALIIEAEAAFSSV
jgi:hypothetical protein